MGLWHVEGHFHYTVEADSEEKALETYVSLDSKDVFIDVSECWEEE